MSSQDKQNKHFHLIVVGKSHNTPKVFENETGSTLTLFLRIASLPLQDKRHDLSLGNTVPCKSERATRRDCAVSAHSYIYIHTHKHIHIYMSLLLKERGLQQNRYIFVSKDTKICLGKQNLARRFQTFKEIPST